MTLDKDVIVFSHLRWTFVWQRPQHVLSRLGARRIWFVEEPLPSDILSPRLCTEQHGDVTRIWLEVPSKRSHINFGDEEAACLPRELDRLLAGVDDPIAWLYTPLALELAQHREPCLVVYDVMDDLASFKGAPEFLQLRHMQALSSADVVFTGGRSLFQRAMKHRPDKTYLFPSGVDPEHYAGAQGVRHTSDKPVAGYVGVIDERIDLELLGGMAERLPGWEIRMVGPIVKIDPADLPRLPNIAYLGQRSYEELPRLMGEFDVALMPFALNESTRSISPTKTLEYLAAGLPVISTRVPDVVADHAEVVELADDAAGFARACLRLSDGDPTGRRTMIESYLEPHHWESIAGAMKQIMVDELHHARQPQAHRRRRSFDFLVVGAGFAGSVVAERLASVEGARVLVCDVRPHVGGNAYDHYNDDGILVHRYGPHIFHTNSREVFDHLSKFTAWRQYEHRVLASVDGQLVPIPINLDTINTLYGMDLTSRDLESFFAELAEPLTQCRTSEDAVVSQVGRELYEKFFRNYTRKQWGLDPSELDASVTSRIPIRTNRDSRYFSDRYQAMPVNGYTRMFENMLDHPNIKVMLNTEYWEVKDLIPHEQLVYTGPIDGFFGYRFGKLPYRSLEFEFKTYHQESVQEAAVINYPNEHPYTRATEFKWLTGQKHARSTVVYEYPRAEGDPYYPIPQPQNAELYKRYKALADATSGVHFVGRLATYKYYNMDQVVAQALQVYRKIVKAEKPPKVVDIMDVETPAAVGSRD